MDKINDAAWFYSSLMQTAGAIVGLIGAVLGSRIIEHIGLLRGKREFLNQIVSGAQQQLFDRASTMLRLRRLYQGGTDAASRAAAAGVQVPVSTVYTLDGGSRSQSPPVMGPGGPHAELTERRLQETHKLIEVYRHPLVGRIDQEVVRAYAARILAASQDISPGLEESENLRLLMEREARQLHSVLAEVASFRRQTIPRSFAFLFIILLWLSVTGILWPLAVLPALDGSGHQVLMLGAFALCKAGLLVFFVYQFWELRSLAVAAWPGREWPKM